MAEDVGTDVGTDVGRPGGGPDLAMPQSNGGDARDDSSQRASLLVALVRTARPRQWVKNVLVAAAPGAAGVLSHRGAAFDTAVAFVSFCLASSGTYFVNDALDVEADRLHPTKQRRPVASGRISPHTAFTVGIALIGAALGAGFLTGSWELPLVVAIYIALTTTYTVWLKHVAVVDLGVVASGFVLRTIAGAVATGVPISNWFFIVASFGSLFMVAGKRHAEYHEMGSDRAGFRSTLEEYSVAYLNYVRAVASGVAMVAYCLWAFDKSAHHGGVPWFELSIVPFVLGVLRYALVVEWGRGGAPEDIVLGDRPLQVIGVAWVIVVAVAIYVG